MVQSWWKIIALAVAEGFSWVLPIPNSGVMMIARRLMGLPLDGSGDRLFLSAAKIVLAVTIWFTVQRQWKQSLRSMAPQSNHRLSAEQVKHRLNSRMLLLLLIAMIPVFVIFFYRTSLAKLMSRMIYMIPIMLFGGLIQFLGDRRGFGKRTVADTTLTDAVFVGAFQALGAVPGLSATGLGITMGIWRGLEPDYAMMLSFMLLAPALLLDGVAGVIASWAEPFSWLYLAGWLVCAGCGYLALRMMKAVAQKRCMGDFALPVWGVAAFLFVLYLFS